MMNVKFDYLVFLVSTDCFAEPLLGDLSQQDREVIHRVARSLVHKIVDGGDNYFLCADFSPSRLEATRTEFYSLLSAGGTSSTALARIKAWEAELAEESDARSTAKFAIGSIAARLFWLDSDSLSVSIADDLMESISDVEDVGLEFDAAVLEWKRRWTKTESKWDGYLKSLLDEVPETPYLTFRTLQESASQLAFLIAWKQRLGEHRFKQVLRFIEHEIEVELEPVNVAAAAEARRILNTF